MKKGTVNLLSIFVWFFLFSQAISSPLQTAPCTDKIIIGQTSQVYVEELDLDFLARIDTGATSTSIHAYDVMVEYGSEDPRENVGKIIHFSTETEKGNFHRMKAEIIKVQTITSAQGREKRYMVRLTLTANGIKKTVPVNLRDRSEMKYQLLIGRDWLSRDFLVDVSRENDFLGFEGEEE